MIPFFLFVFVISHPFFLSFYYFYFFKINDEKPNSMLKNKSMLEIASPMTGVTVKRFVGRTFSRPLVDLRTTALRRLSMSVQRDENDVPADGPTFDGEPNDSAIWQARFSLADLTPSELVVSAFKLADEREHTLLVRLFNPSARRVATATLALRLRPLRVVEAWYARHDEEEHYAAIAVSSDQSSDSLEFAVEAKRIVTILLRLEALQH